MRGQQLQPPPGAWSPGIPSSDAVAARDTAVAASTATRIPPAESFAACAASTEAAPGSAGGTTLGEETIPVAEPAAEADGDAGPDAESWALGAAATAGCKDTWGRTRAGGGVLTRNGEKMDPTCGSDGKPAFGESENEENGRPTGETAGSVGGGTCTPSVRPGETAREGGREVGRDLLAAGRGGAGMGAAIGEAEGEGASAQPEQSPMPATAGAWVQQIPR